MHLAAAVGRPRYEIGRDYVAMILVYSNCGKYYAIVQYIKCRGSEDNARRHYNKMLGQDNLLRFAELGTPISRGINSWSALLAIIAIPSFNPLLATDIARPKLSKNVAVAVIAQIVCPARYP